MYVSNDNCYKYFLIAHNRALKAFITARKPRAFEPRNRRYVSYVSGERGAQESSSSADTGEPETPSPQYSEAVPVTNDRIITRDELDEGKDVLVEPLDPHFARLLNSLSISASKKVDSKSPTSLNRVAPSAKIISTSHRSETPDWSSRVPTFSETLTNPFPAKQALTPGSHSCENCADFFPPNEPGMTLRTKVGASSTSPVATSSPSVTAARKPFMSSRRSSSIADISPYLSRPAEVPASGKRLKQLALLECVADESSKMTPTPISRELPPIHGPECRTGNSGPSTSVPPPTCYAPRANVTGSYELGTPVHLVRGAPLPFPRDHPLTEDLFQVRPGSSQLNHSTLTYLDNRSARNTNQAKLSLLGTPPHAQGALPPTSFLQTLPQSYSTPPLHSSAQSPTIYSPANASEHLVASKPSRLFHAPRDSHAAPPAHAVLPPQARSLLLPSSAQLLSILNGDRVSGHASVSRTGVPSVHST